MPAVELKVVELVDDLLAGLAHEELGVLDDRGVHFLEGESLGDFAKVAKEPVPKSLIFGVNVPCSAGRL